MLEGLLSRVVWLALNLINKNRPLTSCAIIKRIKLQMNNNGFLILNWNEFQLAVVSCGNNSCSSSLAKRIKLMNIWRDIVSFYTRKMFWIVLKGNKSLASESLNYLPFIRHVDFQHPVSRTVWNSDNLKWLPRRQCRQIRKWSSAWK